MNIEKIPPPEDVTKECTIEFSILAVGIQNRKVNVDLIRCTFNSPGASVALLDNCEDSLKAFIVAVMNNTSTRSYEQFVEEIDVL